MTQSSEVVGGRKWTPHLVEFLKKNCEKFSDEQMAAELSKLARCKFTKGAVRKVRQRLRLKKKSGRGISELDKPHK